MSAPRIVGDPGGIVPRRELAPAIDLVHLARQTDGDSLLEGELLGMFDRQAAKLIAELARGGAPARARADIAHTLRGSALAIGADRVAVAARAVEHALGAGGAEPRAEVAELSEAVDEARAAIAALRD
jgi:HPt (histidine-containing phosphotransfer) domain-containing protein